MKKVYAVAKTDAFGWSILDAKNPVLVGEEDDVKEYAREKYGAGASLYEYTFTEVPAGFGEKRKEVKQKIDALSKQIAELRSQL